MKKTLIVLAVLLINSIAGTQQASAQIAGESWLSSFTKRNDTQGVQFGVRAGLNFPTLNGEQDEGNSSYLGVHFGLIVDIPLSSNLYIQPGLYLENKGCIYKYYDYEDGANVSVRNGLAYIDIPVLLSYRIDLSDALQLHLNAGPFVGFGVFGTITYTWSMPGYGDETDKDDAFGKDSSFSTFDTGLSLGAGLSFGKIYCGLKYDFGLVNIMKEDTDYYARKTGTFGITLGLNF
ncbi:MAG: PorT family protein [Prevotellaceae bacterium]|jgi:hypothetical protein|nr:PorT family protein [Prevotellaceae bacterium]